MIEQPPGSTVLRIRLGARLRRLRESRGVSATEAARAIRASDSKISRIELGRHAAREVDVADLLTLYGVTDPAEREELLAMASAAATPPWWHRSADVLPAWFQSYLGLEEAARSVATYDPHVVPGLLQTQDYAAGLLRAGGLDDTDARRLLGVHSERISRFATAGWRLDATIEESVLRRPVGGPDVLASQLRQLREAAERPGVLIRIRPLDAQAPAVPSGFTIVRFDDPDLPDVVYTEQLTSASYLDRPADVSRYADALGRLRSSSRPPEATAAVIDAILAGLG